MKPKKPKQPKRSTLVNKLDKAFSLVIRSIGKCERCGLDDPKLLQCAHIHSRSKRSVRWDITNAMCLCSGCHLYWWHVHVAEGVTWIREKMGEENWFKLMKKAQTPKKWTIGELQEMYEELNSKLQP